MDLNLLLGDLNLRQIPAHEFNRVAIVAIDLVALLLLYTVSKGNRLRDTKSRIFAAMVFFMMTWVNFAYLARILGFHEELSLIFLKIAWSATPPLFFLTYLISVHVIGDAEKYKKVSRVLLILTTVLSLLAFTDIIIVGTKFSQSILDIVYGVGFFPFLFVIFIMMYFTVVPLYKKILSGGSKSFLFGIFIFYSANMVFNIALPVFFGITHLYFLGDYSTIFLLAFTTYSILRHELFDVKALATEVFVLIIWAILIIRMFVAKSVDELIIEFIVFSLMVIFGILLVRNVKQEVKQKEELELLNKKLEDLDAQKDEFLSVAAHEMRAPMTAVKGYISMILDGDGGEIPIKAQELLGEASMESDRMIRLINNMLDVARIEEGRMVFKEGEVKLAEVAEKAFNEFKFETEDRPLEYLYEPEAGVRDLVRVDMDRIHEVVANLISNAIKYTDSGKVSVRVFNPNESTVRLEVEDTGPGISAAQQQKLFQKFYRAESYIGKKIGTGLGLYISKLLVEKFGGTIGFKSTEGKGSVFWFELPVKT